MYFAGLYFYVCCLFFYTLADLIDSRLPRITCFSGLHIKMEGSSFLAPEHK